MQLQAYDELFALEQEHFWFRSVRAIAFDQVPEWQERGARVLDLGCGTGGTLAMMPVRWKRVGLDIADRALSFARRRGNRSLVRGSGVGLPFADSTFDLIFTLDVIEHCDDDRAVAAELRRVLKPGGTLVATVPAFQFLWSTHDEVLHHKRRYRLPRFGELLRGAGLNVRRLTYFNTLLFPPIAAVRLARRMLPSGEGTPQSDAALPPRPVNALLHSLFSLERRLLRHVDLPFGVSILSVSTKD